MAKIVSNVRPQCASGLGPVLLWFLLCCCGERRTPDCVTQTPSLFPRDIKVDSKVMITSDGEIVFSADTLESYGIHRIKERIVESVSSLGPNVFSPFYFDGRLEGLQDINADNNFQPTSPRLRQLTDDKFVEMMHSFQLGRIILYKLKDSDQIILVDMLRDTSHKLATIRSKLHGAVYSDSLNLLVLSYDESLVSFNTKTSRITRFNDPPGQKLNPFVYKNYVYICSNSMSEYAQIFQVDLLEPDSAPLVIWRSSHDLRIPKRQDDFFLYFIEIIDSKYLLQRLDLRTAKVRSLTQEGVVYDYDFYQEEQIVLTYSDITLPRSLILCDLNKGDMTNLYGDTIHHNINVRFTERPGKQSSAYILESPSERPKQGIILYFRPGVYGDFSPRYDPILMNLCSNGYDIVAPNYPTSIGYGKSYRNASRAEALEDLRWWMQLIKERYKSPIHCLSVSGSNTLLETFLVENGDHITSGASLFGTYFNAIPDIPVPTLYILGKHDPFVHYSERTRMLNNAKTKIPISVVTYSDEGHLFRKKRNENDAITKILAHFCGQRPKLSP